MEKVAVVILNYLNYKDTLECIDSLMEENYLEKEIIVVDNNSQNESQKKISQYITENNLPVHFLINKQNEGFARGNNVGIVFARENLACSFVLLVNNDTIFNDKNMISKLVEKHEKGIAVIGPRIISCNGFEQNPAGKADITHQTHQKKQIDREKRIVKFSILRAHFNRYKKYSKTLRNHLKLLKNHLKGDQTGLNLVLHGSCMMLTPEYFKYYPYLYPKTFLYYEEKILTILTNKVGLKTKFVENARIFHKEDQSSLLSFNNDKKIMGKYEKESRRLADKLIFMEYEKLKNEF